MGKLPVNLINPTTLHNILKGVSFQLPENYELIAGARIENIHLYYDLITVAATGDAHHIKIIFNVPLKTANRQFVLYKILALPTRTFNDTFNIYTDTVGVPCSNKMGTASFVTAFSGALRRKELSSFTPLSRFPDSWFSFRTPFVF